MPYTIADEEVSQNHSHSPGIVDLSELLLRLGFHPEHFQEGKIGPAAISRDDLQKRGFSVDRKAYVTRQVLEDRARHQMSNRPQQREKAFISSFSCGAVRALTDSDNRRAFIVIDTAEPENPAHASIYSAFPCSPGNLRRIRSLLLDLLQNYVSLETYLQGNPHP